MTVLEVRAPLRSSETGAEAELNAGFSLKIDMLEPSICRVAIVPDEGFVVPVTWMISPDGDVPWSGRPRLATDGFSCPRVSLAADNCSVVSDTLRVGVQVSPLALTIEYFADGNWNTVFRDRRMAAYRHLGGRGQIHHAQTRNRDHLHLGLGDKAGSLDRTGRRFRFLQTDALGYNAETSDPLYKHVPWLIAGNGTDGFGGVFYDTLSELVFDLGAEHSNYHEHYRTVEVFENALVYYVICGPALRDVVPRFQGLVGKPHLQPRWSSGFAFTSMHHADADDAQAVMLDFARQCKSREIPISALHAGSGYTTGEDGRRYVFTWNTQKFPDKDAFFRELSEAGLHTCANIKPVLLTEHTAFNEVAAFGGFIKNADGEPAIEMFWGGPGASLDFTNPATVDWWQHGVTTQVLGAGYSATWNDNNECEMWDEEAMLNGFGNAVPAMAARPLQAILMLRASFEAALQREPHKRPYTISRAGPAGISRYAQTWSGDNHTSWHTLRWNLANGLSMSLSGMPLVGHDIGGFDGPKPTPELLCRWVEMMALHPRAVMNSWKPAEYMPTTLPWMYPQVESLIRQTLVLRYRLLPWLYHLGWASHTSGAPVISPMFYFFPEIQCEQMQTQFMLGDSMLVAPVIEQGAKQREVYLPGVVGGWYEWKPGDDGSDTKVTDIVPLHGGGEVVTVSAEPGNLPVFVRAGSILPVAKSWHAQSPHDAIAIELTVFPSAGAGAAIQRLFYDDGHSWAYKNQQADDLITVRLDWTEDAVQVRISNAQSRDSDPTYNCVAVGLGGRALSVTQTD